MKKIVYIIICALFCWGCSSDLSEEAVRGSIAGSMADRTTGEPVPTVNVTLTPGGRSTVTGSDGSFSFTELSPKEYTISISKESYTSSTSKVQVKVGQPTMAHLLIERIPASITADRGVLDFGEDFTTLSFTIVNAGYSDLAFKVEKGDCKWMTVDPEADILAYGKTATIVVKIDRTLLASGKNEAMVVVRSTSGNGNVEVKVVAEGGYRAQATLNTLEATEITGTSVKLNGEITNAGAPAYTERGFVWGMEEQPTLDKKLGSISVPVTDEALFTWRLEDLTPTTTYYIRAYLKQNNKVIYGNTITTGTSQQSAALTTSAATNVGATSATLNATVTDAGIPVYTERGFCYSKYGEPTISDNRRPVDGTGKGDFMLRVNGLDYPQTYYARAYVMQGGKPVYGNTVTFRTSNSSASVNIAAATQVTATTALLNASVTRAGEPAYTERGFCYGKQMYPTISDNRRTVAGSGEGNFSLQITGLDFPEVYYVRAYVMQEGRPVYSEQVQFTTLFESVTVGTSAATAVDRTSATLNGTIGYAGMPAYNMRGFCYSQANTVPTISDNKVFEYSSMSGAFKMNITNLKEGAVYYVRAFAVQDDGVVYGNTVSFTTHLAPVIRTGAVSNLHQNDMGGGFTFGWTATFNASVLTTGSPAYTQRGFVYGETQDPRVGVNTSITVSGSGKGAYSTTVTNLSDYKTYYVRAFVKTADGYVYGENVTFRTY